MIRSTLRLSFELSDKAKNNPLAQCQLVWRQGQLLVKFEQDFKQLYLPSLECEQRLVECLKNSSVQIVRLDPMLGESALNGWADACEQAKKPAFLLPAKIAQKLPKRHNLLAQVAIRTFDWIAALLLLIGLSPVMLAIGVLMYLYSPQKIFSSRWQVGLRGKLFKALKFDATQGGTHALSSQLGCWMRKYRLDELPLLVNVLRGEMSLIGGQPLMLSEVVRFGSKAQKQMDVLPWRDTARDFVAKV
jgi:hypothetical protein